MTATDHRPTSRQPRVLIQVWTGFRPYFIHFSIDFLISAFLWIALYLFKLLTTWLSVEGWAGEFIRHVHSAGVVSAALVFAVLFVVDIYALHGARHE